MTKTFKTKSLTAVALLALTLSVSVTACQDDPADHSDLFIGKYMGRISYTNNGPGKNQSAINNNGTATIRKSGASYAIDFSDGIPSVTDLHFKRIGEYDYTCTALSDNSYIKVQGKHLALSYIKGKLEEVWKADCNRASLPEPQ